MIGRDDGGGVGLCSVAGESGGDAAAGREWREVEADGVYVLDLGAGRGPERWEWVVGGGGDDWVSTVFLGGEGKLVCCGGRPCRTHFTCCCRSPALAGLTGRFRRLGAVR